MGWADVSKAENQECQQESRTKNGSGINPSQLRFSPFLFSSPHLSIHRGNLPARTTAIRIVVHNHRKAGILLVVLQQLGKLGICLRREEGKKKQGKNVLHQIQAPHFLHLGTRVNVYPAVGECALALASALSGHKKTH